MLFFVGCHLFFYGIKKLKSLKLLKISLFLLICRYSKILRIKVPNSVGPDIDCVMSETKWPYFKHQLFSMICLDNANFNLFLQLGGRGNTLLPNSSETTCHFQIPFYMMVYLNSANGNLFLQLDGGGNTLLPNSSETTCHFQIPFYRMEVDSALRHYDTWALCHRAEL